MQKVAAPSTVSELDDNFSWLGSARKPQVDELSHFKAPVRINRGKFPCDFFANLKERRASIKLRPLDVLPAKESDIGTPKFSSYASTIPKLVFGKLKNDSNSDETTLASFASNRNTSREYTAGGGQPRPTQVDRIVTARQASHPEEEGVMCNHLRDIIRLTTSMKRVYRKQSLDIKRQAPEPRHRRPTPLQLGSLQLPPLTLTRRAMDLAAQPQSASTRLP